MPKNELFLLDTHSWVWLLNGALQIQQSPVFPRIIRAVKNTGLYLSTISVWEVAMLEAKGRIAFSTDIGSWINQAISAPGLRVVELLPEISIDSTHLPGDFHGDPADRIIVATARHLKCPLVTADKKILTYAKNGYVAAIEI